MTDPHQRTARSGGALRLLRAAVFAAVCVVLAGAGHTLAACAAVPLWTLGAGFLGVLTVVVPLAGRERSLPAIAALLAVGQAVLHTLFGLGQHASSTVASSTVASTTTAASDAALVERAARLVCGAAAAALSPAQAQKILVDARLHPVAADAGTGTGTGAGAGTGMGSMHHSADALAGTAGSSMSLLPSLPMLLGHVLAAVAAGWLLRRGDSALLRLMALSAHGVAETACVRSLRGALALVRALFSGLPALPDAGPRVPRTALLPSPRPPADALQHMVIRRGPPAAALVLAA
ncbi:hypothetical protein BM536_028410 [Streptomyces phaeoluteigriseus]|uniref:Integral membrane protein n=1 Tax=Streptomyces phaeoluteigriseus TaxID=114686 RepID=A0A1V6MMA0_9ACTN|nr:hypothetical protein [Streptomyces phaeoluteigriseus]OQD53403.1 hypothetical protein BM536_028410 [Streptomyces phaeoluteigriseus]